MTNVAGVEMDIERVDGWERLRGSQFVGPQEHRERLDSQLLRALGLSDMVDETLLAALAAAADADGLLLDLQRRDLYNRHVTAVLRQEEDPADWAVVHDRFVNMLLMEKQFQYLELGLLAHRGTGTSADYRLALPAVTPAPSASAS